MNVSDCGLWATPIATEAGPRLETLITKDGQPWRKGEQAYRIRPDGSLSFQTVTLNLEVKVEERMRPTPTEHGNYNRKGASPTSGDGLATAVKMYPTLTTQDASNNAGPSQYKREMRPLNAAIGGGLNPTWVEWLMGYPLGWTAFDPSEMQSYRKSRTK